jgi:hypothetical protein
MGNKTANFSPTEEFYLQNIQSNRFNLNDPNIYAQIWAQIWTQRHMLQQKKLQKKLQREQLRQNLLNEKYPVKWVIVHSIMIIIICIAMISIQIASIKNVLNILVGSFVSFYLISNAIIALIVSK